MPIRKRWPNDDGRQDPAVDYSGCPIPGLDKIPSDKLPDDVKTVFFGGACNQDQTEKSTFENPMGRFLKNSATVYLKLSVTT